MNPCSMLRKAIVLAGALSVFACSKTEGTGSGAQAVTVKGDPAKAKELFAQRCASCHGAAGRGDGVAAAAMTPKPRNYSDAAWQKSVTDEQLRKTIVLGGAAVGKSPTMPGNPDLEGKTEDVDNLVALIREFGKS